MPFVIQDLVESLKIVAVEAKTFPKKGPLLQKLFSAWSSEGMKKLLRFSNSLGKGVASASPL